jgi:dsRNA-specific ribonuclease
MLQETTARLFDTAPGVRADGERAGPREDVRRDGARRATRNLGEGSGKSKKIAEQAAASKAWSC